jgi:hypothetical protein
MSFFATVGLKLLPFGKWIGRVLEKFLTFSLPLWLFISAMGVGYLWHSKQIRLAEKRGSDAAYASITKQANKLTQKANKISEDARKLNNDAITAIGKSADIIRVSGPGKASCSGPIATGSGGSTSGGKTDAPVADVPNQERVELIGLPFPPTVTFAEQHDKCQIDRKTWEVWYKKLVAEWTK